MTKQYLETGKCLKSGVENIVDHTKTDSGITPSHCVLTDVIQLNNINKILIQLNCVISTSDKFYAFYHGCKNIIN